ncbi:preprotein translocase subunit SecG, partial [bacterium]|nr:preprotein translocase subunit SecG [bacterium]
MIYTFFLVVHVLISIFLVVTVLTQASKGGGLAGIAGTGSSSASFGGRQTATLLHKVTVGLAVAFAANCLLLGILSKGRSTPRSVVQETQAEENPLDFLPGVDLTDQQMQGGQGMPDQSGEAGDGMQVQMETAP